MSKIGNDNFKIDFGGKEWYSGDIIEDVKHYLDDIGKELSKDTIDYIRRAITYIKKKIDNPMFFVWSNDFKNLREHFNENEYGHGIIYQVTTIR